MVILDKQKTVLICPDWQFSFTSCCITEKRDSQLYVHNNPSHGIILCQCNISNMSSLSYSLRLCVSWQHYCLHQVCSKTIKCKYSIMSLTRPKVTEFFWFDPAPFTQFRHLGVVSFEKEWPGFEPRTSSIRRGDSIATPPQPTWQNVT